MALRIEDYAMIGDVGNFPQAFSHIGLVNSAMLLSRAERAPTEERASGR